MNTETEIYRDLQKHLDKLPIGYPATESGVEIRILKHLFTPEEAGIATQLSMIPEPLSRIFQRVKKTGVSIEELEQKLDHMVDKGSILLSKKDDKKLYSVVPLAVGSYELQLERITRDFGQDVKQYLWGEFGKEMYRTKIPQMRTIPIEKSIPAPDQYQVSTYDNVKQIIEKSGSPIAVINCVCRQTKDVIGESCTKTDLRETCIVFRDNTEYYLSHGIGRLISKDEALGILEKAQEAGLVLQPENTQYPGFVCCCCGDCCGILSTVKRFPRPAELYATNYYAEVNPDLCNGCGTCVERCQLEARTLINNMAIVNLDRCIGCGICVANCESSANQLKKKDMELLPPKNTDDLYTKIMTKKVGKWNTLKMGAKILLKLRV
ncbi:MAG: 4Fe-4S binding protein [Dehalococcoidales bacterium]|nr:4Fe-4S binding protein [Dehalococcoidales bacterium]